MFSISADGDTSCDPLLLTSSEFTRVDDAKHARNLLACKSGADECDPYLLDSGEAKQVANVRGERALLHNATANIRCDFPAFSTTNDATKNAAAEDPLVLPGNRNRRADNPDQPQQ